MVILCCSVLSCDKHLQVYTGQNKLNEDGKAIGEEQTEEQKSIKSIKYEVYKEYKEYRDQERHCNSVGIRLK